MTVLYTDVKVGDVLTSPNRSSGREQFTVMKKYGNRIVLLSRTVPGSMVHHMDNQFDSGDYERVSSDDVEPPVTTASEAYY